ncbi:MAG: phage polymerase-related protein [Gammaproteobacteria bacterium]|jgi:DNA polymerase|nr:phage polymerase-related protein [Gammaproteobacteria bacterium]
MDKKSIYLREFDIPQYSLREPFLPSAAEIAAKAMPNLTAEAVSLEVGSDWLSLQQQVSVCQKCPLCQTRKNTVFGVGNPAADLMLIGEAPGATEDERGEPFVGQAGQLLDKMMGAIGLSRENVFITNILKCRPPNNRDPLPTEVAECMPYLMQQIAHIKPKLILALGRVAAQNLLNTQTPLGRLRGDTFHFGAAKTPLVVTYHPAYLLRNPADKRNAWVDLQRVQKMLTE